MLCRAADLAPKSLTDFTLDAGTARGTRSVLRALRNKGRLELIRERFLIEKRGEQHHEYQHGPNERPVG